MAQVKSNITDNDSAKMTTSKGTIQGYTGIAAVDKKHQIIIDAQVFGSGQEQHTLQPVLETIKATYSKLKISKDIYKTGTIVTADTGFAGETNIQHLYENTINAYIPDNRFRSRDPKFNQQKQKYGKRGQHKKKKTPPLYTTEDFIYNPTNKTCTCPTGEKLRLKVEKRDRDGHLKVFFQGRVTQCRACPQKQQCMKHPASSDHGKTGRGRQVSFIVKKNPKQEQHIEWMKRRVDSDKGKQIYSHRMSVVEPVFGNITRNKGLDRFSLRSKTKVQSQWRLFCMVHNIEKLKNYGNLAA